MMFGLFGLTAMAVTWPFALMPPSSMGLGPIGTQTVPFRLIAPPLFRPGACPRGQPAGRWKDCRQPGPWTVGPRSRGVDTTARVRVRKVPASPADLRGNGVSRSRDAPAAPLRDRLAGIVRLLQNRHGHDRRDRSHRSDDAAPLPWISPSPSYGRGRPLARGPK